MDLKNVRVCINFHGVLSLELLKQLNTTDEILDYYNEMGVWCYNLSS